MLDKELNHALVLQGARGIERRAAVGVGDIHIDAVLEPRASRLRASAFALGAIGLHPRNAAAHARRRHHGGCDLRARFDRISAW